MSNLTGQQVVLLSLLAYTSAEVLARVVMLTKLRLTKLSAQFYAFWITSILGHVSAVVLDADPVITVNIGYRVTALVFYPVMYLSGIAVFLSRVRIIDVGKRIREWHVKAVLAAAALVSVTNELMRLFGNLILGGRMQGTLIAAPGIVSFSIIFFSVLNIAIYGTTIYLLRSARTTSHARNILLVMLATTAVDLYELAITLSGDFITAYNQHSALAMVKMRLELEIWDDFLQHVSGCSESREVLQPAINKSTSRFTLEGTPHAAAPRAK
ncbi:hypothetical protein RI367_001368 [Sorochytrium milnesiophthora]